MRCEQEAARPAGRVGDPRSGLRSHHLDDRPDQRSRREVLAGPGLDVLRVSLEQALVGVALHVGVEREPALPVDQVDDEAAQLCRILDPVLRLAEDDAQHPRLPAELGEDMTVMNLERVAVPLEERGPVETRGHDRRPRERRPRLLVGHLEEEQIRELLEVVAVREPVVPQDVAVAPQPLDEAVLCAHVPRSFLTASTNACACAAASSTSLSPTGTAS